MKIGLFYAPKGGNVNKVADLIYQKLGPDKVDMFCITDVEADKFLEYDNIIVGNSTLGRHTWSSDQQDKWALFAPRLKKLDLSGKKVAIFGLGDHLTYPWHFVDAIGDLADLLQECNASIVGRVKSDGYKFKDSRAYREGTFMGLPLDEDYESEETDSRLDKWLGQLEKEFKVRDVAVG